MVSLEVCLEMIQLYADALISYVSHCRDESYHGHLR